MKLIRPQGLTTDVVVFTIEDGELKVLLIKRENDPFKNCWALPGSFIRDDEASKDAAERTLKEKAGIRNVYLEQLYTFDGSGRDPRGKVCTISYFALAPKEKIKMSISEGVQNPLFWTVKKLPPLAFDHKKILDYALKRLEAKVGYTNAVYSLLPKYFTFQDLQNAYEIILRQKLDKRNFRKKFMQLKLIKTTDKKFTGVRQRPAQLFQFNSQKPIELEKFFKK